MSNVLPAKLKNSSNTGNGSSSIQGMPKKSNLVRRLSTDQEKPASRIFTAGSSSSSSSSGDNLMSRVSSSKPNVVFSESGTNYVTSANSKLTETISKAMNEKPTDNIPRSINDKTVVTSKSGSLGKPQQQSNNEKTIKSSGNVLLSPATSAVGLYQNQTSGNVKTSTKGLLSPASSSNVLSKIPLQNHSSQGSINNISNSDLKSNGKKPFLTSASSVGKLSGISPPNSQSQLNLPEKTRRRSSLAEQIQMRRASTDVTSMFGRHAQEYNKRTSGALESLQKKIEALSLKKKMSKGDANTSKDKLLDSSYFIQPQSKAESTTPKSKNEDLSKSQAKESVPIILNHENSASNQSSSLDEDIDRFAKMKDKESNVTVDTFGKGIISSTSVILNQGGFKNTIPHATTVDFSMEITESAEHKGSQHSSKSIEDSKFSLVDEKRRKSDSAAFFNLKDGSASGGKSANLGFGSEGHFGRICRKYNSCSTLFIDSSITFNKLKEMVKSAAIGIYCEIKNSHEIKCFRSHDIFNEKVRPLSSDYPQQKLRRIPEVTDVYRFIMGIFDSTNLNSETVIVFMIYMERMMQNTGVTIYCSNWRRVVLGAIILASKVWDDQAIWNVDFCSYFPEVPVKDLNNLERWYLKAIEYNVSVSGSIYARYFLELRDMINNSKRFWTKGKTITRNQEKKLKTYSTNPSMTSSLSKTNGSRSLVFSGQPEMRKNRSDSNLLQLETIISTSELIKI